MELYCADYCRRYRTSLSGLLDLNLMTVVRERNLVRTNNGNVHKVRDIRIGGVPEKSFGSLDIDGQSPQG